METRINEIADGIYRLSTFVPDIAPPAGFTFNQFLVLGDEPLMFHTGLRKMFPLNRDALEPHHPARAAALDRLRPLRGRRVRRHERMARDRAERRGRTRPDRLHGVAQRHGGPRAARARRTARSIDLGGGKRVRYIDTPHTPHGWDAGVLYEESTGTLLCGDLFTQLGDGPALTEGDIVGPAIAAEDMFRYSSLAHPTWGRPSRPSLICRHVLSRRQSRHASYRGDGGAALKALAADYAGRAARLRTPPQRTPRRPEH